ncbi:hypothetical protein NQ317_003257 [Molorchus minor]|uniref:DUF4817 domain-containing protein n=1 Tax=Molorchus minor TaxID=1323400 RepID=A0ABQ9ISK9_9CUCU|nr:hypothetical protein NQ317_003257 [Molorchus minor]
MCIYFNHKYPPAEPLLKTSISKIIKKYEDLGHVRDRPRSGRPAVPEHVELNVWLELQENLHLPSIAVAANSQKSVLNIWHPCIVNLVHELNEDDLERRIQFCEQMMNLCNADEGFAGRLLFSDENRQNCRHWSEHKPHWIDESLYPVSRKSLGKNSARYDTNIFGAIVRRPCSSFDGFVPKSQRSISTLQIKTLWFQQDGAPPDYSRIVATIDLDLDEVFQNRTTVLDYLFTA